MVTNQMWQEEKNKLNRKMRIKVLEVEDGLGRFWQGETRFLLLMLGCATAFVAVMDILSGGNLSLTVAWVIFYLLVAVMVLAKANGYRRFALDVDGLKMSFWSSAKTVESLLAEVLARVGRDSSSYVSVGDVLEC